MSAATRSSPPVIPGEGAIGRVAALGPDATRLRFGDWAQSMSSSICCRRQRASLREYGRIALMGRVGMLGGDDLALPYPWIMRNSITVRGQWMYPETANHQMIGLIRAGLLDLSRETVTTFTLDAANDAVSHAAVHGGPFQRRVLTL